MSKTEFAGNGDGRANHAMTPSPIPRARSSSRKRGTSQANNPLPSMFRPPAKSSSRRKAGAETSTPASPKELLSPRSSSAKKRKGQAKSAMFTSRTLPAQPSAPGDQAGRATLSSSTSDAMRGQSSQPFDQLIVGAHSQDVAGPIESGGERQVRGDTHTGVALTAAIDEIREQWRRRQMWHRAEKSLTLQAKAMCRRLLAGDKKEAEVLFKSALNGGKHEMAATAFLAMHPLLEGRKGIETARLQVEKRLLVLTKQLPVAPWIVGVRGVGMLSLAGIVGEAGDIGGYSNPAKLWKRMGLAVIGGKRQRRVEGSAAIEHGYNPARRSLMWTIGDCIIRAGGPLKTLYDQRKEYEAPRVATKMHAHNRAKRYIEKRLLRDLWRAWRDAIHEVTPIIGMHLSEVQSVAI